MAAFYSYSISVDADTAAIRPNSRKRQFFYLAPAILGFLLACMTKETGVTLVAVLVVFEFIYVLDLHPTRLNRWSLVRLAPFFLISAAVFLSRVMIYGAIGETRPIRDFWSNLFTQFSVIITYLRMLIFPYGLTVDHDYPVYHSLFEFRVAASLVLLCSITAVALISARRTRMFAFGFAWFVIALLPTSLVPIWDIISEHWLYLPSVGYFLMVGAILNRLLQQGGVTGRGRRLVNAIILCSVFLYSAATISRNAVWRDGYTLWSDAVRKAPGKARPHSNLAKSLGERGDFEEAADELGIALLIDPYSYEAHNNLGTVYLQKREYDRAVEQFQLALAVFPDPFNPPPMEVMDVARAFYNMGLAYQQMGSFNSALQSYEKALRVTPRMGEACSNMGTVYLMMGRYEEAEMSFSKALSINPRLEFAKKNLELLEARRRRTGAFYPSEKN
jgi:tetratricopeptide (TPR) repeat protein